MRAQQSAYRSEFRNIIERKESVRTAVGYIRVSTDMQATDGLSLDAQTSAIEQYCAMFGVKLVRIHRDVLSGAKSERPGLQAALSDLQKGVDVLVVLKFDRLSRSIKHFCEVYERYFQSGEKELVAIRESIRLDSSLGRALVSILLVFAQMEREAIAERTREALRHMREHGYCHGKAPFGFKKAPKGDGSRYKVFVEDPAEQRTLAQIKEWLDLGLEIPELVRRLNADGVHPPRAKKWRTSFMYLLVQRQGWWTPKPHNQRTHSDEEAKARIVELRNQGHTFSQIASMLNEQKWLPLKGRKFTAPSVGKLLRGTEQTQYLTPRQFLEALLRNIKHDHERQYPDEPFQRPGFPRLAVILMDAGYKTPKGNAHWWPAQVQQLLEGQYDHYYRSNHPDPV